MENARPVEYTLVIYRGSYRNHYRETFEHSLHFIYNRLTREQLIEKIAAFIDREDDRGKTEYAIYVFRDGYQLYYGDYAAIDWQNDDDEETLAGYVQDMEAVIEEARAIDQARRDEESARRRAEAEAARQKLAAEQKEQRRQQYEKLHKEFGGENV